MANIHDDALKGILTADLLNRYISDNPSVIDSPGGDKSVTPLAAACWRGHIKVVHLLLENPIRPAEPDALSPNNRTPLFYATSGLPSRDRCAIVRLLLDKGADVDLCYANDGHITPLMNAILLQDKDLVHELVDRDASLTRESAGGQTAMMLAKEKGMESDLLPRDERNLCRAALIDILVAFVVFIINSRVVKDVVCRILVELSGVRDVKEQHLARNIPEPHSTEDLQTGLTRPCNLQVIPKPHPVETPQADSNNRKDAPGPNPVQVQPCITLVDSNNHEDVPEPHLMEVPPTDASLIESNIHDAVLEPRPIEEPQLEDAPRLHPVEVLPADFTLVDSRNRDGVSECHSTEEFHTESNDHQEAFDPHSTEKFQAESDDCQEVLVSHPVLVDPQSVGGLFAESYDWQEVPEPHSVLIDPHSAEEFLPDSYDRQDVLEHHPVEVLSASVIPIDSATELHPVSEYHEEVPEPYPMLVKHNSTGDFPSESYDLQEVTDPHPVPVDSHSMEDSPAKSYLQEVDGHHPMLVDSHPAGDFFTESYGYQEVSEPQSDEVPLANYMPVDGATAPQPVQEVATEAQPVEEFVAEIHVAESIEAELNNCRVVHEPSPANYFPELHAVDESSYRPVVPESSFAEVPPANLSPELHPPEEFEAEPNHHQIIHGPSPAEALSTSHMPVDGAVEVHPTEAFEAESSYHRVVTEPHSVEVLPESYMGVDSVTELQLVEECATELQPVEEIVPKIQPGEDCATEHPPVEEFVTEIQAMGEFVPEIQLGEELPPEVSIRELSPVEEFVTEIQAMGEFVPEIQLGEELPPEVSVRELPPAEEFVTEIQAMGEFVPEIQLGEEFLTPESQSVEQVQTTLETYVTENSLQNFWAPDDLFLQTVAKNAAALKYNDPLNTLDNIKHLTYLSLYQLVLYCDDSTSMCWDDRFENLRELVQRIAAIATRILPDNFGVELRFINAQDKSNVSSANVDEAMASVEPSGVTDIGTNLREKILKPLVYDVLSDPNRKLQRPLLICTVTDGEPYPEPSRAFKDAIMECRNRLMDRGYKPNAVMFCVSQIGNSERATEFLKELRGEKEIEDVLYCTTDRLDEEYRELKANERRLEEWLLKTLTTPIMERNQE